ncbi:hypothetical protein CEXT_248761 [Caerostris extrusa]|uniref:Transmembrane protein n=1 Tax=Caerostris extrusa TaxID=172846 RepID=A0AAV4RQW0_CAEEX|nr:hypothetical protein CEXT_248761 [Caerostris extrusa]
MKATTTSQKGTSNSPVPFQLSVTPSEVNVLSQNRSQDITFPVFPIFSRYFFPIFLLLLLLPSRTHAFVFSKKSFAVLYKQRRTYFYAIFLTATMVFLKKPMERRLAVEMSNAEGRS